MIATDPKRIEAGTALYSHYFLCMYDWLALGYNCRFIWKCPSHHMLELYNKYVSANHLDIGVATGYFMDKCEFPGDKPRLVLMDLNHNSLRTASKRLARYNPGIYQRNALDPFDIDAPAFDSIGMLNLLHCIPGNMKTKGIVFENVKAVMNPDAVLFGSTILYGGVKRSAIATCLAKTNNRFGIMSNIDDNLDDLRNELQRYFSNSSVETIGCVALFGHADNQ